MKFSRNALAVLWALALSFPVVAQQQHTSSANLPILIPYQASLNGAAAGFVAAIDTTRSGAGSCVYATYLGGSNAGTCDTVEAITLDGSGLIHTGGRTCSASFPILNGFQSTMAVG